MDYRSLLDPNLSSRINLLSSRDNPKLIKIICDQSSVCRDSKFLTSFFSENPILGVWVAAYSNNTEALSHFLEVLDLTNNLETDISLFSLALMTMLKLNNDATKIIIDSIYENTEWVRFPEGHPDSVEFNVDSDKYFEIFAEGFQISDYLRHNCHPLIAAIEVNDFEIYSYVVNWIDVTREGESLEKSFEAEYVVDDIKDYLNPVTFAVILGRKEILRDLLHRGFNVNAQSMGDGYGETPFPFVSDDQGDYTFLYLQYPIHFASGVMDRFDASAKIDTIKRNRSEVLAKIDMTEEPRTRQKYANLEIVKILIEYGARWDENFFANGPGDEYLEYHSPTKEFRDTIYSGASMYPDSPDFDDQLLYIYKINAAGIALLSGNNDIYHYLKSLSSKRPHIGLLTAQQCRDNSGTLDNENNNDD